MPARLTHAYALCLGVIAVVVSFPEIGELWFRGYFVQDADEVIRAWYGRCAFDNPNIIPYSHLSMPGWTVLLAICEAPARLLGLPLALTGRLVTVAASWLCLRSAAGWVRAVGGTERIALCTIVLIAATPGYFLLSLSVYPSIALAALTVTAARLHAEGRTRAAAAVIAWAPLLRWEGALLLAVFLAWALARRAARELPILLGPYAVYLLASAWRYGNPWEPLAYRTTRHMGAWLVFNPDTSFENIAVAARSLAWLWPPLTLVATLAVAAWLALRHRERIGPVLLAYAGLTVSLLSIWHETTVWALRVFATPTVLGTLVLAGAASAAPRLAKPLLGTAAAGTLATVIAAWITVNATTVPPPGGLRFRTGFHLFARSADAAETVAWLHEQEADWIIVNHLNANLLRADPQCSLYDLPLRLGAPRMSLSREFLPAFGLPEGEGLVVFHATPVDFQGCAEVMAFPNARQRIYRCPGTDGARTK